MATSISSIDEVSLPSSVQTERAILGSLIVDNKLFYETLGLFETHFYVEAHGIIYRSIKQMLQEGYQVDLVTLTETLRRRKELEFVGGTEYLSSLTEGLPQRPSLSSYCAIVREKCHLREVIEAGKAAVFHAADDSDTAIEVINELESRIAAISSRTSSTGYARIGEIVASSFGSIDELYRRKRDVTGLATHFRDFDRMTCGLQDSDLH